MLCFEMCFNLNGLLNTMHLNTQRYCEHCGCSVNHHLFYIMPKANLNTAIWYQVGYFGKWEFIMLFCKKKCILSTDWGAGKYSV